MSDLALGQVVELIAKVTNDVRRMGELSTEQSEQLLRVIDDLAAGLMAIQAVTAVQLKTNPVDPDAVHAWLTDHMDPDGEGTDKARAVANILMESAPAS
ncbi:hypothetical protein [Roseospira visakhapatnamensis]|uniref:Uncharacterized protein n=1 Tax=Roseospira visakhapatnamensis TaxID=390880 RepID=A0A7W6RES1_9PROT|nr:hypothetical protein [Roseospira visakhapatnamensis]MBB4266716.1 hypothetical protein [Roseospira visakhapatnamensis]